MAHIEKRHQKRSDGTRGPVRWRARYVGPDGKERSKTFDRKLDAERWLIEQEATKAKGTWVDPVAGRKQLSEWADQYMRSRRKLKPKTRVSYESLLRTCIDPHLGSHNLSAIQPLDVEEWVGKLVDQGLSASRVRQAYNLLGAMLKKAVVARLILSSPCVLDELPRVPQNEQRFLTALQVNALAESIEAPYELLVLLLAYTGMRYGEATALRRGRCNILRNRLVISESMSEAGSVYFGPPKNHQQRVVMFPKFLSSALEAHLDTRVALDPEALVFTLPSGVPLRYSRFRRRYWDPAVTRAGLDAPLGLHALRRTFASLAASAGASVKMVQNQLGHSDPALTLRLYQHLFEDDLDALAIRLDGRLGPVDNALASAGRPGDGLAPSDAGTAPTFGAVTRDDVAPSA